MSLYTALVCAGASLEGSGSTLRVEVSEVSRVVMLEHRANLETFEDEHRGLWYAPNWRKA